MEIRVEKGFKLLLLFPVLITPRILSGQGEKPVTSCYICHEVKGKGKVGENGVWHKDHKEGEVCHLCHGGDETAKKEEKAHEGMVKPMEDTELRCGLCHQVDLGKVIEKYTEVVKKGGGKEGSPSSPVD